jgi:hypothetical protein
MNTRNKIASLLGGAAMLASVVGMTAGLAPAAAAPKQDGAWLAFTGNPNSPGNYLLVVNGAFPMEQPDAQGYINNINTGQCGEKGYSGILYDIWGDDGEQQQHVEARWIPGARVDSEGRISAGSRGLEYSRTLPLPHYYLDEDRGSDVDEIYVRVRFVDADCGTRDHTTQVASHRF